MVHEGRGRRCDGGSELCGCVRPTALGRRNHQRPVLGADGVVGRDHAGRGIARDLRAIDEVQDGLAGAKLHDQPPVRPGRHLQGTGAADDRRHLGTRHQLLRQLRGGEHRPAPLPQPRFGQRHHFDHALIGLFGAFPEGEDAVLVKHQPMGSRVSLVNLGGLLRQREARHDVRHHPHPAIVKLRGPRLAVRLIDEAEHRGGMGVVHEFVRDEGVQQRLDGRIGRHRVQQVGALHPHHLLIGQRRAFTQHAQLSQSHRRQAGRLDDGHVGTRAFDAKDIHYPAHQIGGARLDRGVAAAMQHEARVAAEETRRVDPQRQVARHLLGSVGRHHGLGVGLHEAALHGWLSSARANAYASDFAVRQDTGAWLP